MPYPAYPRRPDDAPAPFGFVPPSDPAYLADADNDIPSATNTNAAVIGRASRIAPWVLKELIRRAQQGLELAAPALKYEGPFSGAGGPIDPRCKEEWAHAAEYCQELYAKRRSDKTKNLRGFNLLDCMKQQVSEDCGGTLNRRLPKKRRIRRIDLGDAAKEDD